MSIRSSIIVYLVAGFTALAPALPVLAQQGLLERLQLRRENVQERQDQKQENIQERRQNVQEQRQNLQEKRGERKENIQEKRENIQQRVQERRENIQERLKERRERLQERRKEIIRAFFGRMLKRFEAALERQSKLADRIQSRIEKARANGKDVANAQAALDRAKALWSEAKSALETAKSKLETALNADTPKQAFEEVRALIQAAREKIKGVHVALVEAITALKGIGGGTSQPTATSTTP